MQFIVEAAGVADGLAVVIAAPQRRIGGAAVGAGNAHAPVAVSRLQLISPLQCLHIHRENY